MLKNAVNMVFSATLVLFLGIATGAIAQEGHPLVGSWHGAWGKVVAGKGKAKAPEPQNIVMFLKFDNKNVNGTLNPGRNSVPFNLVTLNPSDWTVHLEAHLKDGQHVVADGKLENIGSYHRTITGTWSQGTEKGEFKLTRD